MSWSRFKVALTLWGAWRKTAVYLWPWPSVTVKKKTMVYVYQNRTEVAPAILDAKLRQLKARWSEIVGHDLAAITSPLKLGKEVVQAGEREGGALYIEISPYAIGVAQQLRCDLPKRINGYLGEEAVVCVLLVKGRAPGRIGAQTLQRSASRIIKRRCGMSPIAANLPRLTRQILGKKRMLAAEIIENWPLIVGPGLAEKCLPLKYQPAKGISDVGSLLIKVDSAFVTKVQYQSAQIIDRLNQYFGYRAVGKINFRQAHGAARKNEKNSFQFTFSSLTSGERTVIEKSFEDLENSKLRDAMIRLQSTLTARKK